MRWQLALRLHICCLLADLVPKCSLPQPVFKILQSVVPRSVRSHYPCMYNSQRLGTKWKLLTLAQREYAHKQTNKKSVINTFKCGDVGKSRTTSPSYKAVFVTKCCRHVVISLRLVNFLSFSGQLLILKRRKPTRYTQITQRNDNTTSVLECLFIRAGNKHLTEMERAGCRVYIDLGNNKFCANWNTTNSLCQMGLPL